MEQHLKVLALTTVFKYWIATWRHDVSVLAQRFLMSFAPRQVPWVRMLRRRDMPRLYQYTSEVTQVTGEPEWVDLMKGIHRSVLGVNAFIAALRPLRRDVGELLVMHTTHVRELFRLRDMAHKRLFDIKGVEAIHMWLDWEVRRPARVEMLEEFLEEADNAKVRPSRSLIAWLRDAAAGDPEESDGTEEDPGSPVSLVLEGGIISDTD